MTVGKFDTVEDWLNTRFVPGQLYQMTGWVDATTPILVHYMWHHKTGAHLRVAHKTWVMFISKSLSPATGWIAVLHDGRIWHTSAYNFELHLINIGMLWPTWFKEIETEANLIVGPFEVSKCLRQKYKTFGK